MVTTGGSSARDSDQPKGVFHVGVDAEHGARWTSLRDPSGKEWLWSRPDPARDSVRPGHAFVDIGGMEECFPTISGEPDHGDVWSRPWRHVDGALVVERPDYTLRRGVSVGEVVHVSYLLEAEPGLRFIWSMHTLVAPDVGTRVEAPSGHRVLAWPGTVEPVEHGWPLVANHRWDVHGPDDGTAVFALLPGLDRCLVHAPDGRSLRFDLDAPGQPAAMGIFRNLGGFPVDSAPYRTLGIEPMIGHAHDLSHTEAAECGHVPTSGTVRWDVRISS